MRIAKFESNENGFSMVELIIVLLVGSILTVLSIMAFRVNELHFVDRQAHLVSDMLNEARQRALTQHETMRVEFNKTRNTVSLITENAAGNAADDAVIKTLPLEHPHNVNYEIAPSNMTDAPVDTAPAPAITFSTSTHPLSLSDQVAVLRFTQTGTVLNAGSNAIGANAAVRGATIYFWMPERSGTNTVLPSGIVLRAITVLGSTGAQKYWRCSVAEGQCTDWQR